MHTDIITIGDEILIGQIIDTNSAWMAQKLSDEGIDVRQITSISARRKLPESSSPPRIFLM